MRSPEHRGPVLLLLNVVIYACNNIHNHPPRRNRVL